MIKKKIIGLLILSIIPLIPVIYAPTDLSGLNFTKDNITWNFANGITVENFDNIGDVMIQPTTSNEFRTYIFTILNESRSTIPYTVNILEINKTLIDFTISGGVQEVILLLDGTPIKKIEHARQVEPSFWFDEQINYIKILDSDQVTIFFPEPRFINTTSITEHSLTVEPNPTNSLTDRQIDFIINTIELYNPDPFVVDQVLIDLKTNNLNVYQVLTKIANGDYGSDRGLFAAGDYISKQYLARTNIDSFADLIYSQGLYNLDERESEAGKTEPDEKRGQVGGITNHPPQAIDDSYSAVVGTQLVIPRSTGILTNDIDRDLDVLVAIQTREEPTLGRLNLNDDGSFTYTPTVSGGDSFTYFASDGQLLSNEATVNLSVQPNTPPVAASDTYTSPFDTVLNVNAPGVLSNDIDAESNVLTAELRNDVITGSLTLNSDGSFSYSPPRGFIGTTTFSYVAFDGLATSNEVVVTINVI